MPENHFGKKESCIHSEVPHPATSSGSAALKTGFRHAMTEDVAPNGNLWTVFFLLINDPN
jgi:hypothetical protein